MRPTEFSLLGLQIVHYDSAMNFLAIYWNRIYGDAQLEQQQS